MIFIHRAHSWLEYISCPVVPLTLHKNAFYKSRRLFYETTPLPCRKLNATRKTLHSSPSQPRKSSASCFSMSAPPIPNQNIQWFTSDLSFFCQARAKAVAPLLGHANTIHCQAASLTVCATLNTGNGQSGDGRRDISLPETQCTHRRLFPHKHAEDKRSWIDGTVPEMALGPIDKNRYCAYLVAVLEFPLL